MVNLGKRVYDLYKTSDRLTTTQNKLKDVQKINEDLKKQIAYQSSDFYVEKEAREKLNLAKSGERVVVIPGLAEPEQPSEPIPSKPVPNWQKWYSLFFED